MLFYIWAFGNADADVVQYIKAMRLFQEEPKWTPLNRGPGLDGNQHRKAYVESYSVPSVAAN